jgi:hypothetical protein
MKTISWREGLQLRRLREFTQCRRRQPLTPQLLMSPLQAAGW